MRIPQAFDRFRRLSDITFVLAKHGLGELNPGNSTLLKAYKGKNAAYKSLGRRLCLVFEDLGPTFIKVGQLMSTRYDIFPAVFIDELEKLQDTVNPLPFDQIEAQVEKFLEKRITSIYRDFDTTPIASASIAQVHRARLGTGEDVVVKVRRPGIRRDIEADLDMLLQVARSIESTFPRTRAISPTGILNEFKVALKNEMDFEKEALNAIRFRKNFKGNDGIVIPKVYKQASRGGIITLEYLDGVKITEGHKIGASNKILASRGFKAILKMIFVDGFLHADPHPANVFALEGSRVAFLDHGMVGELPRDVVAKIVSLLAAVSQNDADRAATLLINMGNEMGLFMKPVDDEEFRKDARMVLDTKLDMNISEFDMIEIALEMMALGRKYKILVPTEYALVFKAIATIETIGRKLDPEFDINGSIQEFMQETMATSFFGIMKHDVVKS